jgi:hypothetical protein
VKALAEHGGERKEQGDNGTLSRGSNSASYLVRRLKRDAPEVAAALARGEYRSAWHYPKEPAAGREQVPRLRPMLARVHHVQFTFSLYPLM